jgi:putative FmdB family regulatory protein
MPLYEYLCPKCGEFEFHNKLDEDLVVCPLCKSKVEKLISCPGVFDLRGKGFYVNDYAKKKSKKEKEE